VVSDLHLPIETERLIFRAFEPSDFDWLFETRTHPDVVKWMYWDAPNEEEMRAVHARKMQNSTLDSEKGILELGAVSKESKELVADLMLRWVNREWKQGELGYIVHPDHGGRGYATESARALLQIGFDVYGMHRIIGRTEARHAASARVLEKIGMRKEAHFVENEWVKNEWQSEVVYAILESEWRGRP